MGRVRQDLGTLRWEARMGGVEFGSGGGRKPRDDWKHGMIRRLQFVVWSLLVSLHPLCLAQLVTIRVIDVRNGRPVPDRQVSLSLLYAKDEKIPAKDGATLRGKTDSSGQAEFRLPEPRP